MNAENRILLQSMPQRYIMEKGKGYDNIIGYTIVVLVSASYSRAHWFLIVY